MQEPSPEHLKVMVSLLRQQRDQANDQIVQMGVQISLLSTELERLKKSLNGSGIPEEGSSIGSEELRPVST